MHTTVQGFFDPATWTVSYVVADEETRMAAIIDPVLDFDFKSGRTSTKSANALLAHVRDRDLTLQWILETHAHADHLSSARYLRQQAGGRIAIGENIRQVQAVVKNLYNLERMFLPDGSQFDHLFKDGEKFMIGNAKATALLVPGHTPADMAYLVDGAVLSATRCSCPTSARLARTFQGAMRTRCTARCAAFSACHPRHECSCATTTRPMGATRNGRPPWPTNGQRTFTYVTASRRTNSWACDRRAMRPWICQRSFFLPCRSMCVPANCRHRKTTASLISRSR